MQTKSNKNNVIIIIGLALVVLGIMAGSYEYFLQKRNETFSKMNVELFESETPETIKSEQEYQEKINNNNINNDNNNDNNINQDNGNANGQTVNQEKPQDNNYNYIGILEIPKINIKRGFLSVDSKYNNVDYNITVVKGSTLPDVKNNNLILAAHSGDCSICYFHDLYKVSNGDTAYIYYEGIKYEYKVINIYEVEKTGKVAIYRDFNKNVLTLITCTRNSDTKQTVYILELINEERY